MLPIILASASPRRKELLEQLQLTFEILPACGPETIMETDPPQVVIDLSRQKAEEIAKRTTKDAIILGADTIVTWKNKIMGKPKTPAQAVEMLTQLSGRTHSVYTGVTAIIRSNGNSSLHSFAEETRVTFYSMTSEDIDAYVATKDPMDKAGAYGIQGICAKYIKGIEGDYNNVVGLPIGRLYQEILQYYI